MTALDQSITEVGRTMCLLIPSSFGERPSASPASAEILADARAALSVAGLAFSHLEEQLALR